METPKPQTPKAHGNQGKVMLARVITAPAQPNKEPASSIKNESKKDQTTEKQPAVDKPKNDSRKITEKVTKNIPMDIEDQDNDIEDTDYEDMEDTDDEAELNPKDSDANEALSVLLHEGRKPMEVVKCDVGFMCSVCESNFRSAKQCEQHGAKKLCYKYCNKCGKQFVKSDTDAFEEHLLQHDTLEQFPCSSCKKVFNEQASLNIHQLVHSKEKKIACTECDSKFYTSFQQASHLLKEHKKSLSFTCDVCKAKFVNISFMKAELRCDGGLSYFKCVMCAN